MSRVFAAIVYCLALLYSQTALADVRWVSTHTGVPLPQNLIPSDVKTEINNEKLEYVCRAALANGIHPGYLVNDRCNISELGQAYTFENFEIAVVPAGTYSWVRNSQPINGIIIGGRESDGRPFYVCRAQFVENRGNIKIDHGWQLGKAINNNCFFAWGGREIGLPSYEILYNGPQPSGYPVAPITPPPSSSYMASMLPILEGGIGVAIGFVAGFLAGGFSWVIALLALVLFAATCRDCLEGSLFLGVVLLASPLFGPLGPIVFIIMAMGIPDLLATCQKTCPLYPYVWSEVMFIIGLALGAVIRHMRT